MRLYSETAAILVALLIGLAALPGGARADTTPAYLDACAAPDAPVSCFVLTGFTQPDAHDRTIWVAINDDTVPADLSFYLYDPNTNTTIDSLGAIGNTVEITPGGHFEYPGISRPIVPVANELTAVFTSTARLSIEVVGPTVQCPRAPAGNVTCAQVYVPAGSASYSFYNQMEMPDIVWIHQPVIDGVVGEPFSDVMSGNQTKQYATGLGGAALTLAAATPHTFKDKAFQYTGGPLPPRYQPPVQIRKLYMPLLHR